MATQLEELLAVIAANTDALAAVNDALRSAARAANDAGRIASLLQREAQDCEYEPVPQPSRDALQSLLQRTGYVNLRAADLANKLREVQRGLRDLTADCERLLAAAPPLDAPQPAPPGEDVP